MVYNFASQASVGPSMSGGNQDTTDVHDAPDLVSDAPTDSDIEIILDAPANIEPDTDIETDLDDPQNPPTNPPPSGPLSPPPTPRQPSTVDTFLQRIGLQPKKMISTPNPRNGMNPYWGEAKNAETDGKVLSSTALATINALPTDRDWDWEYPDHLRREADAVLASLAKTQGERKTVEQLVRELRYRTDSIKRPVRDPRLLPEDQEVAVDEVYNPLGGLLKKIRRGGTPPSDEDYAGTSWGGGRGGGGRGGDGGKGSNKRTFSDYTRTTTAVDLGNIPNQRPKRAKKSNAFQPQPPADLSSFQPIRLNYASHPLEEQSDDWFISMFRQLFTQTQTLVTKYYAVHDLDTGAFFEPWSCGVSPEFISWAETIAEPDPAMGGWDAILRNTEQRQWFIMGIIMRIIQRKIFDEELFGANQEQKELMRGLERALIQREGFSRQCLRSETVRTIIGRSPTTENFYAQTALLTAQISLLLAPLTDYLYRLAPPDGIQTPNRFDLYQDLHSLISNAAYLSISIRLSQSIFHLVPLSPGQTYDPEDHLNLSQECYTQSKAKIITKYNAEARTWTKILRSRQKKFNTFKTARTVNTLLGRRAQARLDEHKSTQPHNPGSTHRALVGISSWPVVTRYKAGSDEDDNVVDKAAYLPDKDGFRIFQICKGGGVFYYGRERRSGGAGLEGLAAREGGRERLRLRHWVRDKLSTKAKGMGSGVGGVLKSVVQLGVMAGMLGMGYLVRERGFDEVFGVVTEGIREFVGI